MKKVLLVLLTLMSTLSKSQPVTHTWATGYGGLSSSDDKMRTVVDNLGNIYVIGEFQGTKTFGSTTLTSISNRDVFVSKFSNSGACLWAIKCSGPNFTSAKAGGITIDNNYNLYITGYYAQSLSVGVQSVTATGQEDIFIARLDNAGNCVWLKSAGFFSSDKANDIAFDGSNGIYITGSFESFAYFDATTSLTSVAGTVDIFLAKYDLTGTLVWVKSAGGNQPNDVGLAVKVDNAGNPVISGYFSGVSTFGSLPNVTSLGFGDLFVAKYSASNGNATWVTRAGGVGQDEAKGLGLDAQNNVYVSGIFSDTIFVNGTQLNDNGYVNALFIKMNSSGVIQFAKRIGGSGLDVANDIAVEPGGHFYITGQYTGTASFGTLANGNGASPSLSSSPPSNVEIFVAKYGGGGTPLWAFKMGNTGADIGKSVVSIGSGKVLAVGEFSSLITLGSTTLSASIFGSYLTELSGGTLGLNNSDQVYTLKSYPNPAANFVKVELPFVLNETLSCEISNIKGQIITENNLTMSPDRTVTVNFRNLTAGVYSVRLFNTSFESVSKVIIE